MAGRTERLDVSRFEDKNALRHWTEFRNPFRVTFNILILTAAKFLPLKLKNVLLRIAGVKLGRDTSVGFGAVFDIIFPELIEVGENTTIGYGATILAHEATQDEFRTGNVEIGKNVLIGANTTVLPGVKIGDGATVSANSLVNSDVEKDGFVGGVPAENLDR